MIPVPLLNPTFANVLAAKSCELRVRRTSIRRARPLLGTFVEITAGGSRCDLEAAVAAAFAAIARVQRLMSFHDPASDVSRLNRHGATRAVRVDGWTWSVIAVAIDLHRRSHGAFDIAVASALQELGLLPKLRVGRACGAPLMRDAVEILGGHRVRFRDPGACIDLGGIAKGFAVDRAVDVLRAQGVESGLVNAGGDLAAFGPNAWSIHLRDPRDPRETIGTIDIRNEALASTGRGFDPRDPALVGSTAVIDPSTRAPVGAIAGASVRARSAMMADALTKVVMIAREDAAALLDDVGASALLVRHDGEIRVTSSWQRARAA